MSIFSTIGSLIAPGIGTVIGAGLDLAGTAIGAGMQSSAARDAARIQASAADQASAESRRQFDLTRADLSPWMQSGRNALGRLDQLLGVNAGTVEDFDTFTKRFTQPVGRDWTPQELSNLQSQYQSYKTAQEQQNALNPPQPGPLMRDFSLQDFQADPGYQFRLGEGTRAIENSAAARGMQLSGPTLKALNRFTQDFASNEYSNAWNRDSLEKQRQFNFLTGQSGTGQQTAGAIGSFGTNASNQIAGNYLQAANAQASGRVGSANAWGNAIGDVTDYYRMRNLLRPTSSPTRT